jgi:hypothetical protein
MWSPAGSSPRSTTWRASSCVTSVITTNTPRPSNGPTLQVRQRLRMTRQMRCWREPSRVNTTVVRPCRLGNRPCFRPTRRS